MFVSFTDYHGHPVRLEATRLLKLRPALANLNDPDGCTLVDWGTGGSFALGNIGTISGLFSPYLRLAGLHAPDGSLLFLNADAIDAVLVDPAYGGRSAAVVRPEFANPRVPARNRIGLLEDVNTATAALDAAKADHVLNS